MTESGNRGRDHGRRPRASTFATGPINPGQLPRLTSPERVRWLRSQVSGYFCDLAARAFFRLPTWCADQYIPDPKFECADLCASLAAKHALAVEEARAAFNAEWRAGMKIAEQVGEKLRIAGLSHIKITGSAAGIEQVLRQARNRFPAHWPYLTDANLDAIAAGFHRPSKQRRPL
jgi:hypothetical protein